MIQALVEFGQALRDRERTLVRRLRHTYMERERAYQVLLMSHGAACTCPPCMEAIRWGVRKAVEHVERRHAAQAAASFPGLNLAVLNPMDRRPLERAPERKYLPAPGPRKLRWLGLREREIREGRRLTALAPFVRTPAIVRDLGAGLSLIETDRPTPALSPQAVAACVELVERKIAEERAVTTDAHGPTCPCRPCSMDRAMRQAAGQRTGRGDLGAAYAAYEARVKREGPTLRVGYSPFGDDPRDQTPELQQVNAALQAGVKAAHASGDPNWQTKMNRSLRTIMSGGANRLRKLIAREKEITAQIEEKS